MKLVKYSYITILAILLAACTADNVSTGSSLLSSEDNIVVGCDTFSLFSQIIQADNFNSAPDSFLLGEADNMFGTIDADIMTQLACPVGYKYPETSEVDSVVLYLFYNSWYGSDDSPLSLRVYEMDKATFDYNTPYPLNLDVSEFCSLDESTVITESDYVITAKNYRDSVYSSASQEYVPCVKMKLKQDFAQRFFNMQNFESQEDYNNQFKGLYITSSFGGSTVLYVTALNLAVFYHFSYSKEQTDTIVNDAKVFYANSEVRQVNRITYPVNYIEELKDYNDSVTFVVAPANIYTRISIPMSEMGRSINDSLSGKRPYVNRAQLVVPVLNYYTGSVNDITRDDWSQPAQQMLLVKENSAQRFFEDNELPSDTCAILSELILSSDDDGKVVCTYTYDLSQLLTIQLRQDSDEEVLNMLLIPVNVITSTTQASTYSSSTTSIISVRPQQTISATAIRSAQNSSAPMVLDVTYTGL